jgi:hypothetical protein
VNGELNNETLQSLGANSSASAQQPASTASPGPVAPKASERPPGAEANATPLSVEPLTNATPYRQVYPSNPAAPALSEMRVLARTPFETAPPEVQRNVIVSAQIALARRGFYHEEINGVYGPAMETSLRAYQARGKLPVTGQLDLETLAALRLLPQPRQPFYDPARRRWRPPPVPPPRGERIPD